MNVNGTNQVPISSPPRVTRRRTGGRNTFRSIFGLYDYEILTFGPQELLTPLRTANTLNTKALDNYT